jgi:hypothetical protein
MISGLDGKRQLELECKLNLNRSVALQDILGRGYKLSIDLGKKLILLDINNGKGFFPYRKIINSYKSIGGVPSDSNYDPLWFPVSPEGRNFGVGDDGYTDTLRGKYGANYWRFVGENPPNAHIAYGTVNNVYAISLRNLDMGYTLGRTLIYYKGKGYLYGRWVGDYPSRVFAAIDMDQNGKLLNQYLFLPRQWRRVNPEGGNFGVFDDGYKDNIRGKYGDLYWRFLGTEGDVNNPVRIAGGTVANLWMLDTKGSDMGYVEGRTMIYYEGKGYLYARWVGNAPHRVFAAIDMDLNGIIFNDLLELDYEFNGQLQMQ